MAKAEAEAEAKARRQHKKGLATIAYDHNFWFMPMSFFEACGFTEADRLETTVALWKPFDACLRVHPGAWQGRRRVRR